MVRNKKPMRNLMGIFKDKASLIKAALSIKRAAAAVHVAVLRATTHSPSLPPPPHRVSALLSLGRDSRPAAWACVAAILDRLHATRDAYVALKCLITLHHVASEGSVVLKDQLSFYPSTGGRNFLNMSRFRDKRDPETWELSSWVRWYAAVLEGNLTVSRVLGTFLSSDSRRTDANLRNREELRVLTSADLVRDLDCLVDMVEEISRAPESLEFQRNDLVYEVVNFVGEYYRSTQYRILGRLGELGERIDGLSSGELSELTRSLERLEVCRGRLSALFVNKKRNDAFWEVVGGTKARAAKLEEERERGRWLVRVGRRREEEEGESTRCRERVGRPSQVLRLPYSGDWHGVDRVHFHIEPAMA
ncbi:putative clathrin assembly protein At4g40080 [Rhododendron vialii]|uniref:putative clathrin assembly protein At4g40080 n=1 Tax=Rhododendron vialii TaxID=182163 RepID=UPI00265F079F|nr:putative clathrin assembly protein At4g40080 [Rhododendron vialii]